MRKFLLQSVRRLKLAMQRQEVVMNLCFIQKWRIVAINGSWALAETQYCNHVRKGFPQTFLYKKFLTP